MQKTDDLYKRLLSTDHYSETKVVIRGTTSDLEFDEASLMEVRTDGSLFSADTVSIGGALNGSVTIRIYSEDISAKDLSNQIPKAAEINVYERLAGRLPDEEYTGAVVGVHKAGQATVGLRTRLGDVKHSAWLRQGVYYIDERYAEEATEILNITGLDKMVLAEADYPGSDSGWPEGGKTALAVVQEIAAEMGVTITPYTRQVLQSKNYPVKFPSAFSMREVLGYIAAMYVGNFIFTKDGELALVAVNSLPDETHFLIDQVGRYIVTKNSDGEKARIYV